MKRRLPFIFLLVGTLRLHAQGYIIPNGVREYFDGSRYMFTVVQNPTNFDYTGFFLYPQNNDAFQFSTFLDEGVRVFLVSPGDPISLQPILSQTWTELLFPNYYSFSNEVPFYVGFYTHTGYTPVNGAYSTPVFGWARLVNFFGQIEILDSALEIEGGGIIAGTQTIIPIPEPSAFTLAALGLGLLGFHRWRTVSASQCLYGVGYQWQTNGVNLPGATNATLTVTNALAVACDTNEVTSITSYTNQILTPVLNWLTNNPTKRPQYVIMFYEMPTRTSTYPNGSGSVGYNLRNAYPGWQPYVNNLNAGTLADCKAYVDKIKFFGTNYSLGQLVISPSAGGYGNTNYILDGVRDIYPFNNYTVSNAINGLLTAGVSTASIIYSNGLESSGNLRHLTNSANLAGYISWGVHSSLGGSYATDGKVQWSGNSGWWIIETIESFNGVRDSTHGNFVKWLSGNAFGGTNYSCTPVGAVVHVEEPGVDHVQDSSVYFGLWASGKNFAACAWGSRNTELFEAVGDPFVTK